MRVAAQFGEDRVGSLQSLACRTSSLARPGRLGPGEVGAAECAERTADEEGQEARRHAEEGEAQVEKFLKNAPNMRLVPLGVDEVQ